MWLSKRNVLGILGVLVVVGAGVSILYMNHASHPALAAAIDECLLIENENQEIDCLYRALEDELHDNGIEASMHAFRESYRRSHAFASTGCHRHAHRIGDMVYYDVYWSKGYTVPEIDFPQETTACGYGFFHGFLEHLVQDQPDPTFVTKVCEGLREKYTDTMGDIGLTCYHGSGHGFTLAQLDEVSESEWGTLRPFVRIPAQKCESLSQAQAHEKEECLEGIFNVIVDWMEDGEYGFSYNYDKPLALCNTVRPGLQKACYYEMAQKLDFAADLDAQKLRALVSVAPNHLLERLAFQVGIAGFVQQRVAKDDGYTYVLKQCNQMNDPWHLYCIESLVNGLYEHGEPQYEYERPLALCRDPLINSNEAGQELCYAKTAERMPRFYAPEKIEKVCQLFPAEYTELCHKQSGLSNG